MASGKQRTGIHTSVVPSRSLMTEPPVFSSGGAPPPETEVLAEDPVFGSDLFVQPKEDQWLHQLAPAFYKNVLLGLAFIPDAFTKGAAWPLSLGAEALGAGAEALGMEGAATGLKEAATELRDPATLGGFLQQGFEAIGEGAEALTGDRLGFDVTPQEPITKSQIAGQDIAALTGGAVTFALNPAAWFRIAGDAGTRVMGSPYANNLLQKGMSWLFPAAGPKLPITNPSVLQAFSNAATQYGQTYMRGLGTNPLTTIAKEVGTGFTSGIGYSLPGYVADNEGQFKVDLGPGIGEVDILPTLKVMSAVGFPIGLSMTPTGIALSGGAQGKSFMGNMWRKATGLAKQLTAGFSEKGQKDLAARIWMDISDPAFMKDVFLPAVKSGTFVTPKTTTPIRLLEDGTIIPATGGINRDTLQALRALGYDDLGLASYELSLPNLSQDPVIVQARSAEAMRRKRALDATFEQLKTVLQIGDPAETHEFFRGSLDKLEKASVESLDNALNNAARALEELTPVIGREEASKLARGMLDEARITSEGVEKDLWHKDIIGTSNIEAKELGDFAAQVIKNAGRTRFQLPFRYFELAGKTRLNAMNIGQTGKPLTPEDLKGLKHTESDQLVLPLEIGEDGLFDVFGEKGSLTRTPANVSELQDYRSALLERSRRLKAQEKFNDRRLLLDIAAKIQDEIVVADNLRPSEGEVINLEALETAREYTKNQAVRFRQGPIGGLLGYTKEGGDKIESAKFLRSLMKAGPESGSRVEVFRDALNEPVKQIGEDNTISWGQPAQQSVTRGDSPDVVEAELLHRFTESFDSVKGVVTQKQINAFLRRYGEAVDKVEGLRDKFNDMNALQEAVDNITWRLTNPSPQQVQEALEKGATLDDINDASTILTRNLNILQQNNAAAVYLNADPQVAAREFMGTDIAKAEQHANELRRLLDVDETGTAEAGFRAGLWQVLYEDSRIINPETNLPEIGMDTAKYQAALDKYKPYLVKFFNRNQMAALNELAEGGPLQEPGIRIPTTVPGSADVMEGSRGFGYKEGIGIVGRKAGEIVGRWIGLNPLVSIGMGRRIGYYVFGQTGRRQIIQFLENAFRDPVAAADLIERYTELPTYATPKQLYETAAETVQAVGEDPRGTARTAAGELKEAAKPAAQFVKRTGGKLKSFLIDRAGRAARLGLIPAAREAGKITLEEDYEKGPPFEYEENKRRYNIENQLEQRQSAVTPPKASRGPQLAALNVQSPIASGSLLDKVQPFLRGGGGMGAGTTAPGTTAPGTEKRGKEIFPFDRIFTANQGGLVSLCAPKKPRQMVS